MSVIGLLLCWSLCLGSMIDAVGPGLPPGPSAIIYTAPVKDVIQHADLVVRGRFLAKTGKLSVDSVLMGSLDRKAITIQNTKGLPPAVHAEKEAFDAVLFLRSIDDRFYLPVSSDPDWVSPHAAIKKVSSGDRLIGLIQSMPGPPIWTTGQRSLGQLGKDLEHWKKTGRFARQATLPQMLKLRPKDREKFYAAIEPDLDYYTRTVNTSSSNTSRFCARVSKLMDSKMPALTLRGAQALLYFGKQTGTPQPRRDAAERTLIDFAKKHGHQWIKPALMDELRSMDLRSNKRSAARVMRAIGGKHALQARDVLIELRAKAKAAGRDRLATPIHFALVYLGFDPDQEQPAKNKKKQ